uniref:Uncharacterized protein n=1 Tax=Rhinopithecus bieti TaxID=61621 RepID=A0A2K6K8M0_RHIBE
MRASPRGACPCPLGIKTPLKHEPCASVPFSVVFQSSASQSFPGDSGITVPQPVWSHRVSCQSGTASELQADHRSATAWYLQPHFAHPSPPLLPSTQQAHLSPCTLTIAPFLLRLSASWRSGLTCPHVSGALLLP